ALAPPRRPPFLVLLRVRRAFRARLGELSERRHPPPAARAERRLSGVRLPELRSRHSRSRQHSRAELPRAPRARALLRGVHFASLSRRRNRVGAVGARALAPFGSPAAGRHESAGRARDLRAPLRARAR